MLQIIEQNPYRILGISSDSSNETASLVADIILKSPNGKCETNLNLPGLKPVVRNNDTIRNAIEVIKTSKDCRYKFFWFIYDSSIADQSSNLETLNASLTPLINADGIIGKHNIVVSLLLKKQYAQAILLVEELFTDPRYAATCLGNPKLTIGEMKLAFSVALFNEDNADTDINWKQEGFDSWHSYLSEEIGQYYKQTIDNNINRAKSLISPERIDSYKDATWSLKPALKTIRIMAWYAGKSNHCFQQASTKLCNLLFSWANHYVKYSQDPYRYKNVCFHVLGLESYCPTQQLDYYAVARGSDMTDVANYLLSHEHCTQLDIFEDSILKATSSPSVNSKEFKEFLETKQQSMSQLLLQLDQAPAGRRFVDYLRKSTLLVAEKDLNRPGLASGETVLSLLKILDSIFSEVKWSPELLARKKKIQDALDSLTGTSSLPNKDARKTDPTRKQNPTKKESNTQSTITEDSGSLKWLIIISLALILIELIIAFAWNPTVMLNMTLILGIGYILARLYLEHYISEIGQAYLSIFAIIQFLTLFIGSIII